MKTLAQLGISIDEVTDKLTDDGVTPFCRGLRQAARSRGDKTKSRDGGKMNRPAYKLPANPWPPGESQSRRLALRRQDPPPVAARCVAVDRRPTKPTGWAGSTSPEQIAQIDHLPRVAALAG